MKDNPKFKKCVGCNNKLNNNHPSELCGVCRIEANYKSEIDTHIHNVIYGTSSCLKEAVLFLLEELKNR